MTSHSQSEQSSAISPEKPDFPFAAPAFPNDPKTIIHRDRQPEPAFPEPNSERSWSTVWKQLFPALMGSDSQDGQAAATAGPNGIQLENYLIEECIGQGGMGAVFRARDLTLNRYVALKVLAPTLSREPTTVKRFQNEARAAAQLDQENISRVYYFSEDKGVHFIVYEYVQGKNIRDMIREQGRLHPADAVNYTLQIAAALGHMDAAGVVHRDVKPSNILITAGGRAKLVDLGLARIHQDDSSMELTIAGTTLGTFDYISPEQAKDPRKVDVRSDIYSLGCSLYHMLAGRPPYPERTVLQKLLDHQGNEAPDPAKDNRHVSPELSMVVRRMMASDPANRYQTPQQLISDLLIIAQQLGMQRVHPAGLIWNRPTPAKPGFLKQNLAWMTTAALLMAILVAADRYGDDVQNRVIPPTVENSPGLLPVAESDKKSPAELAHLDGSTEEPEPLPFHPKPLISEGIGGSASNAPPVIPGSQSEPEANPKTQSSEVVPPTNPKTNTNSTTKPPENTVASTTAQKNLGETSTTLPNTNTPGTTPEKPETKKPEDLPPTTPRVIPESQLPIVLVTPGGKQTPFNTLEAACAAASDGDEITLHFDGVRRGFNGKPILEKPLTITSKSITISGAEGKRPLLEFTSREIPATGFQTRMITVNQGSVFLNQVDIVVHGREEIETDQWALLSLQQAKEVKLDNVSITFPNELQRPATVIELTPGPQRPEGMDMVAMGDPKLPDSSYLSLTRNLIRGHCSLVEFKQTLPAQLDISQSVIAIDQTCLNLLGEQQAATKGAVLKLKLDHVTGLFGRSFIDVSSGDQPARELLPVEVDATDNILLTTHAPSAFVSMAGSTNISDFRQLLQRWKGSGNYYEDFEEFWHIHSTESLNEKPLALEEWVSYWATQSDSLSSEQNPQQNQVEWKSGWRETPLSQIQPGLLKVETKTTGTLFDETPGADLSQIPLMQKIVKKTAPQKEVEAPVETEANKQAEAD